MTRVLVCGGRDYQLQGEMFLILDHLHSEYGFDFLVHGDASGADRLASRWANQRGVQQIKVPANWNGPHKKGAGPLRNQLMLDLFDPDVIVAFPGGSGTYDMVTRANDGVRHIILSGEVIVP
jgi:hypothetical protein